MDAEQYLEHFLNLPIADVVDAIEQEGSIESATPVVMLTGPGHQWPRGPRCDALYEAACQRQDEFARHLEVRALEEDLQRPSPFGTEDA